MTEMDMEIQKLRRENLSLLEENLTLKKEIGMLKEMHYCDLSEIVYQRRQIDFLMDSDREKKGNCE